MTSRARQKPEELENLRALLAESSKNCQAKYLAEAGVFVGLSARLIAERMSPDERLCLYDTWCGLPPGVCAEDEQHWAGSFRGDWLALTKRNLAEFEHLVQWYPGLFKAETAEPLDALFRFVHCDLDVEDGTREVLAWFTPRVSPGGIIVVHDYTQYALRPTPGVLRAVDSWAEIHVGKGWSLEVLPSPSSQVVLRRK